MSNQNLNVALVLSLQDRLTAANRRVMADVRREYQAATYEFKATQAASASAATQIKATGAAAATAATQLRAMSSARMPSSMLSWLRDASRMTRGLERSIAGVRAGIRALPAAVAALNAAKFVLADPVRKTMDYDLRLAHMANTAFTDRDTAGRQAGMQALNAAVVNAVRVGGGSRDQAAETLDALIASGAFTAKQATAVLPTLQRYSTAANADPTQLGNIAIRGMQTFKVSPEELPRLLDMAITAGQAGGFELRDMAKWLPQQMAAARLSGMTGMPGMAKLLAANQAVAITAGTKDEAGNNLVNLLAKINTQDTARDAQKLGINLSGTLAAARSKGMNSLDAFVGLVDTIVAKDQKFASLRRQAAATGDNTERRATFDSMADILQGSAIGKIIQDRQALMALIGLMNNRDYMHDVERKVLAGGGAGERNFATIQGTAAFQARQLGNEKEMAMQTALDQVNPLLGSMASWLATMAREHPKFSAAVVAATTALTVFAAMTGAAGLMSFLGRGAAAGAGSAAAGAAGAAGGGLLARMGTSAALLFGVPSMGALASMGGGAMAASAGLVGAAGAAGFGAGTVANWGLNALISKIAGRDETLGTLIHEFTTKEIPLNVTVDVRNGNIVAEVNRVNNFHARRN